MEKAQNLYNEGFLQYIRCCKKDDQYFIKSSCKAELKKHMKYICDIKLFGDGEVDLSMCDCPVGQSTKAHCKHIIVTLIALLKWRVDKFAILEATCTEKLQTFHKPTKKYTGSPVKSNVFQKRKLPPKKKILNSILNLQFTDDFQVSYSDYFKNVITSSSFNNNMTIKQILQPANTYAVEWDHGFYSKVSNEYKVLKSLGLVDLSVEEATNIEFKTIDQNNNDTWKQERCIRLTASLFHSCCMKVNNEEGARSLVKKIMNGYTFTSKATNHGIIHEESAIQKFQELNHNALNIQKCGLFVPVEKPYIGATPDRLLGTETIVEVKCPYSIRYTGIHEKAVPYIQKDKNGCLQLKEDHPYYYQVQGQLYATKRNFCDFIIYTFIDFKRITVYRNEKFISEMLAKLDLFYENYLKPALLDKYLYKSYYSMFEN
ncbi:uncharacterized protein LOC106658550 [Trichogramma pretiosum]|uniref:uncharacterized protein LOC106658550 n=1 Tax=Trichogramma pretiosum TaxID=7493 RepID=UPI000C718EEA|nr:uncharacterized protein LOC106658550 [Trichogramma pretiosum]